MPASAGLLLGLRFDPEEGGYMFARNIRIYPNCTAIQPSNP
jgi:hypothetical protein